MVIVLDQNTEIATNQLNSFADGEGVTGSFWFCVKDRDSELTIEPSSLSPLYGLFMLIPVIGTFVAGMKFGVFSTEQTLLLCSLGLVVGVIFISLIWMLAEAARKAGAYLRLDKAKNEIFIRTTNSNIPINRIAFFFRFEGWKGENNRIWQRELSGIVFREDGQFERVPIITTNDVLQLERAETLLCRYCERKIIVVQQDRGAIFPYLEDLLKRS